VRVFVLSWPAAATRAVAWRCPADLAALDPLSGDSPSASMVGANVSASSDLADDREEELDTLRDRPRRTPDPSFSSEGGSRALPLKLPFAFGAGSATVGDIEGEAKWDCGLWKWNARGVAAGDLRLEGDRDVEFGNGCGGKLLVGVDAILVSFVGKFEGGPALNVGDVECWASPDLMYLRKVRNCLREGDFCKTASRTLHRAGSELASSRILRRPGTSSDEFFLHASSIAASMWIVICSAGICVRGGFLAGECPTETLGRVTVCLAGDGGTAPAGLYSSSSCPDFAGTEFRLISRSSALIDSDRRDGRAGEAVSVPSTSVVGVVASSPFPGVALGDGLGADSFNFCRSF
jgi:hypothetical protein